MLLVIPTLLLLMLLLKFPAPGKQVPENDVASHATVVTEQALTSFDRTNDKVVFEHVTEVRSAIAGVRPHFLQASEKKCLSKTSPPHQVALLR